VLRFWILARPGADLSIVLLLFLQTKTQYTALTMWPVWARDFRMRIAECKKLEYWSVGVLIRELRVAGFYILRLGSNKSC
jgi:hypothetical protein